MLRRDMSSVDFVMNDTENRTFLKIYIDHVE